MRGYMYTYRASITVQKIKNLPATQETQVRALGREDPQEEEMQSTPAFLPGESQGQRSLVGLQSMGSKSQTRLSKLTLLTQLIHFVGQQKVTQHCKAIILQ